MCGRMIVRSMLVCGVTKHRGYGSCLGVFPIFMFGFGFRESSHVEVFRALLVHCRHRDP